MFKGPCCAMANVALPCVVLELAFIFVAMIQKKSN
uniref:Uncharacterized protein n=1 Tax=Anguilla anguilla TaxID=7936 RepID=A0A0E9QKE9_ANGAN